MSSWRNARRHTAQGTILRRVQLLHIIQFKEAVKNGHRRTMQDLDIWEKNIAKAVERRIKEAEGCG